MNIENPLPSVDKLDVTTLKFRYFAYNCFEMKLPDGKTLVIDPCLKKEGSFSCGYDENDLEACDFVYVNHTHGDHVATLGKVYDKFHPLVLAHERVCYDLAEAYDVPPRAFIPYECGNTYDMGSFKIEIVHGRHNDIGDMRLSGRKEATSSLYAKNLGKMTFANEAEQRLFHMGTLYNYNFVLILPNNLRIGFIAGAPGMSEQDEILWKQLRPEIVMAQRCKYTDPEYAEKMAHVLEVTGAQIMLPLHIEDSCSGQYDPEEYAANINKVCAEKKLNGRFMFMQRAKWYELTSGIRLV